MDKLEDEPEVAEELGIIRFTYVRESSKCNIPKIQASGYKSRQIIGIAPQEKENDAIFRKYWAEKIIHYLGNQKCFASNYRKHLSKLFQDIKPVLMDHISFDDEYERFDTSTEYFFHGLQDNFDMNPIHY